MASVRHPAVADMFYPGDPQELTHQLDQLMSVDIPLVGSKECPRAIVVPHAGYPYSGEVAAKAYRLLQTVDVSAIKRILLLGPSHRVLVPGAALPSWEVFETPLGEIPIDPEARKSLLEHAFVTENNDAHRLEHSLEVQLPFLQTVFEEFSLIPLVIGEASAEQVARLLDPFWDDDSTLIVVSTDLSHYHSYEEAQQLDRQTHEKIMSLEGQLNGEQACGCRPLNGLLHLARQRQATISSLALQNSGDSAGDKSRVVGYASYVLH